MLARFDREAQKQKKMKANELMQTIHQRMRVLLVPGREKNWLPPQHSGMTIFPPFPSELMTAYRVTKKINRLSFNEPEAIRPVIHVGML
jgi:putative SOS response-associated peptidase YedK